MTSRVSTSTAERRRPISFAKVIFTAWYALHAYLSDSAASIESAWTGCSIAANTSCHERERPVVPDAGDRERRIEEVGDAASFAQELGDHADAERVVGLAPRRLLEDRAHAAVDRSRGDGAAVEDREERRPARDDGPELLGDPLDEAEVDGAVAPGRRADGHEDDVGVGGRRRQIG